MFLSPVKGLLTDSLGRRRVLVSSLFVWNLAGSVIVLRPRFRWYWHSGSCSLVLALGFVQGAVLAGIGFTTITLLSGVSEDVQRNSVLGVNTAVLSAGAAAFPLVGGAFVTVSWGTPFVVYLLGVPVALVAFVALERRSG